MYHTRKEGDDLKGLEIELATLTEHLESYIKYKKIADDEYKVFLGDKLEKMNEIRDQLAVQKSEFLTNDVFRVEHAALCKKVESIEKIVWRAGGAIAILIPIIQIVLHFLN